MSTLRRYRAQVDILSTIGLVSCSKSANGVVALVKKPKRGSQDTSVASFPENTFYCDVDGIPISSISIFAPKCIPYHATRTRANRGKHRPSAPFGTKVRQGTECGLQGSSYSVHADQQKIKDKKLRGKVQKLQNRFGEVAYNAARSEMLLPTDRGFLEVEGMEKTYKVKQDQLLKQVDITTAQKVSIIFFVLIEGI
jgi:hypothetical protein